MQTMYFGIGLQTEFGQYLLLKTPKRIDYQKKMTADPYATVR
ncbi:hypothetical protein [Brevibacillus reuszeri]|nr:hypothetical protein [Brevibacillus reuszeri]